MGQFLLGMCHWPLSTPTPLQSILWPIIIDRILVTFGQICNFRDPNLVTFYFHESTLFLNGMKNTLFFIYNTNILVRLLTVYEELSYSPKCENIQPHSSISIENAPRYSQCSLENATPSSGTSPLASCKEVPPRGQISPIFPLSTVNYIVCKTVFKKILLTNKM